MTHPDSPLQHLGAEGARLYYRDDGAGPAVVLIHGWLLDSTVWRGQVASWASRLRVLRPDRRGFGASTATPNLAEDARDVVRLLDHLGIRRAAVVGMSQAARIALHLADIQPGRVACLVLDGTPALASLPGSDWLQETPVAEYREQLAREGIQALRERLAGHPLMQLRTQEAATRALLAAMIGAYTGADLVAPPAPSIDVSAARLAQLDLPALVLNGALDTEQRLRVAATLAGLMPGAEPRLVPDAGHLACLDGRETYNAIVLEFLIRHLDRWAAAPGRHP